MEDFIYGKDKTQRVVAIEPGDGNAVLFIEDEGGVTTKLIDHKYFIIFNTLQNEDMGILKGDLYYKCFMSFTNKSSYAAAKNQYRGHETFTARDHNESVMLRSGVTFFKGMKPEDVSILSFDIETTTLAHNENSKVLLISNTYRKNGKVIKKLFAYDDYESDKEMIKAWCRWVRKMDPSILTGHNIFMFDLPYLKFCAEVPLKLGRDDSAAKFSSYTRKYRKDGSQFYEYNNVTCYGRQIIDTFFLSIKYDIGRNFPSYGLKPIIKHLGIERENRVHFDAGKIHELYQIKEEWEKIKAYAIDDADDALALYDLMIPSYFYFTQSIPRSFQEVINTASGSQVNSFLIRSYLQEGHSLPRADFKNEYSGGISYGNPGIYKDVYKVDVASLYPSIIRQYKVSAPHKDPLGHFIKMVDVFTEERLKNKKLAKETGESYYKDLEQSQKIFINSAYGFLGAAGLNFNHPESAALITKIAREILQTGIKWAESKGYHIVNVDTDSFSYTGSKNIYDDLEELNSKMKSGIVWEDDGVYDVFVVVKAKNYFYQTKDNVQIKGSGLKATMKEPGLTQFMKDIMNSIIKNKQADYEDLLDIYNQYVEEILNISEKTIGRWCSKKTITESVLNPKRTNEAKILKAIGDTYIQQGDKIYVYFDVNGDVKMKQDFNDDVDKIKLLEKLHKSVKIFSNIIDTGLFINYKLKKNQKQLDLFSRIPA